MSWARRGVQLLLVVATLAVAALALGLIVLQTSWARGHLRALAERQAEAALDAEVTMGRLTGTLLFGATIDGFAISREGQQVVAIERIRADYDIINLLAGALVIDQVLLEAPVVRVPEVASLGGDRGGGDGTGRTFAIEEIVLRNGRIIVGEEPAEAGGVRVPDIIRDLDANLSLRIAPGATTIGIDRLSFVGEAPEIRLQQLSGTVVLGGGDLALQDMSVRLAGTAVEFGVEVENVQQRPGEMPRAIDVEIASAHLSFPELARLVPAVDRMALPDDVRVEQLQARGPLSALMIDVRMTTRNGRMGGAVTADLTGPQRAFAGTMSFADADLAHLLDRPALPSQVTGRATFDVSVDTSGEAASLTGTYDVDAAGVTVAGYTARNVRATGRLGGQTVVLERLSADAYGGGVTAAGEVTLPFGGQSTTYQLRGRASGVDLQALPDRLPVPDLQTDLHLSYQIESAGTGLTGRVQLEESSAAGGVVRSGTTATFDTRGDRVAYEASGAVDGIDPQEVARALELEAFMQDRFAGGVTGSFSVRGRGGLLEPLQLTLRDTRLFGGRIPEMAIAIDREEDALRFEAEGAFEGIEPGVILQDPELSGSVTGALDVSGALDRGEAGFQWEGLALEGEVRLTDGTIEGIAIDALQLAGSYGDGVLRLEQMQLESPALTMEAEGRLAMDAGKGSQLTYEVSTPALGAFHELTGLPLDGQLRLSGTVTGLTPLAIEGRLAGTDLAYDDMEATTLNASYDAVVPIDTPALADVRAEIEGAFIRVAGRTLTEVMLGVEYSGRAVSFDARLQESERTITASGRVVREVGRSRVELSRFGFDAPQTAWTLQPGTTPVIDYGGDDVAVRGLRLVSPNGEVIVADGTLGAANEEESLEIWIEGLSLADVDGLVLGEQGLAGQLSAYVELTGSFDAPVVDGQVTVIGGAIKDFEYDRLTAAFRTADAGYAFTARLLQTPEAWLFAEGRVPASILQGGEPAAGQSIDVRVRSSPIALGFVGALTDAVREVDGTLEADVRITGSLQDPSVSGRATVRDATFVAPALGTSFRGGTAEIDFEPEAMVIREFRILDENGEPLRATGRLPYAAGRRGEVTIAVIADNFEMLDSELGDVQISADLQMTGTLLQPRLEGSVRVPSGELRVDRILDLRAPAYYRAAPLEGEAVAGPSADAEEGVLRNLPLALAIDLELPALEVRGRNLRGPASVPVGLGDIDLTVEGDLRLEKAPDAPLEITGDIRTVRGTYEFQGRRFEILRDGTVSFPGLVAINPSLDVTAERVISGVEAQVRIGGTLRQPELTLTSQPPLDEADILSLIVFNQPANQLGASEQISLGRRAAALAAGFVASRLAESIGGALDLDILEIDTGSDIQGLSPVVTVGEQFGERLFLRLRQGIGGGAATQLSLEYELTDWARLQSSVSDTRTEAQSLFRRAERSALRLIFFFSY